MPLSRVFASLSRFWRLRRQAFAGSRAETRLVRLGDRQVIASGMRPSFWSDLHHHAMTVGWPGFFASIATVYVLANIGFALLYMLGDDPIANARPGHFLDYFFFSVETFATVGYGDMHPHNIYGHLVATLGTFVGISSLAVTTGLIFTRFAQPRARLLFARNPVVSTLDNARTLMIRFANARHNMIADASAKLWLIKTERTAEGQIFRRIRRLALVRDESPIFALSWTIMHVIDESSPLHGWTADDFASSDATFVVIIEGHDESSSYSLHARKNYSGCDIAIDSDYVDIMSADEDGLMKIDYTRFHDTRPASRASS